MKLAIKAHLSLSTLLSLALLLLFASEPAARSADTGKQAMHRGCQLTGNSWTVTRVKGTRMETTGPYVSTRRCPDGSSHTYTWTQTTTYLDVEYWTLKERASAAGVPCLPLVETTDTEINLGSTRTLTGYACPGECCELRSRVITTVLGPVVLSKDIQGTSPILCPNGGRGTRTTRIREWSRDVVETIHEDYEPTGACPGTACQDYEYPGATAVYLVGSRTTVTDDCH